MAIKEEAIIHKRCAREPQVVDGKITPANVEFMIVRNLKRKPRSMQSFAVKIPINVRLDSKVLFKTNKSDSSLNSTVAKTLRNASRNPELMILPKNVLNIQDVHGMEASVSVQVSKEGQAVHIQLRIRPQNVPGMAVAGQDRLANVQDQQAHLCRLLHQVEAPNLIRLLHAHGRQVVHGLDQPANVHRRLLQHPISRRLNPHLLHQAAPNLTLQPNVQKFPDAHGPAQVVSAPVSREQQHKRAFFKKS